MKNYMIIIWDVLDGSGIEDVLEFIYKGAAHRSVMNVHNFNYSLRSCKLVYTALGILFLDSFIKSLSSSSSTTITNSLVKLKEILKSIPSDFTIIDEKKQWFAVLINEIDNIKLSDLMDQWAKEQCELNQSFQFWYFVYRKLLEPLILMYMSIRLCNFDGMCLFLFLIMYVLNGNIGRNAALFSMAPIFFATNHRNYARLAVQHLMDLKSCSAYLRERLERSFAVTRTNRPFSSIAFDQGIECSINKFGKGRGTLLCYILQIVLFILFH